MINKEDTKDLKRELGAKATKAAVSASMDSHKRWGNSGIKGFGVNSPAMMEARAGFDKKKAMAGKMGLKRFSEYENRKADKHSAIARTSKLGWEDPRVKSSASPKGHKQSYYRDGHD